MSKVRPRGWFNRLFAKNEEERQTSPYHAVSIRCTGHACDAARNSVGERHLSAEAPMLPLERCDRPDRCDCRYQHYDDRRGEARRRTDQGLSSQGVPEGEERRAVRDRRKGEEAEPFSVSENSYYEHMGDTVRTRMLDKGENEGFDPYNSGSFDREKTFGSDK